MHTTGVVRVLLASISLTLTGISHAALPGGAHASTPAGLPVSWQTPPAPADIKIRWNGTNWYSGYREFNANPFLPHAVSKMFAAGIHGEWNDATGAGMHWSLAPFVTVSEQEMTPSALTGGVNYFGNDGTRRGTGLEAVVSAVDGRLRWFANYTYVRATFEESFLVLSERKFAEPDHDEHVEERLPGISLHSAKLGLRFALTPRWQLALDSITTSSSVLRNDADDQLQVNGFTIVSARGAYRFDENLVAFIHAENIFDTQYASLGTFADPALTPLRELHFSASDPRFLGPGAPRGIWIGLRFSR